MEFEINWSDKKDIYNMYNYLNCADYYIIGVMDKINIFAYIVKTINVDWLKFDKTSKNSKGESFKKITFRPSQSQMNEFINNSSLNPLLIMSLTDFSDEKKRTHILNNGEMFEKIIVEKFNQQWRRTNVPFDIEPDLKINNINFQIKFIRAEICNENNLQNAYNRHIKKISP